jgi:hypothetical protein
MLQYPTLDVEETEDGPSGSDGSRFGSAPHISTGWVFGWKGRGRGPFDKATAKSERLNLEMRHPPCFEDFIIFNADVRKFEGSIS